MSLFNSIRFSDEIDKPTVLQLFNHYEIKYFNIDFKDIDKLVNCYLERIAENTNRIINDNTLITIPFVLIEYIELCKKYNAFYKSYSLVIGTMESSDLTYMNITYSSLYELFSNINISNCENNQDLNDHYITSMIFTEDYLTKMPNNVKSLCVILFLMPNICDCLPNVIVSNKFEPIKYCEIYMKSLISASTNLKLVTLYDSSINEENINKKRKYSIDNNEQHFHDRQITNTIIVNEFVSLKREINSLKNENEFLKSEQYKDFKRSIVAFVLVAITMMAVIVQHNIINGTC